MGNKLSPILANTVIASFDEYFLSLKGIIYYKRYADDTFIIYDNRVTSENEIINKANDWKDSIKFTHETEKSGVMNFLDVTIKRGKNRWIFTKFTKTTSNLRFPNAKSYTPMNIKVNTLTEDLKNILITTLHSDKQ